MSHPGALSVRLVLTLVSLSALVAATFGSDPPAIRKDAFRDFRLAQKVRDALREDKDVSLLKLRVIVRERVAILDGEIATEEQLREAAQRVEKVPGIAEVRIGLVKVVAPKTDDVLTIPLLPEPPSRTETLYPKRNTSVLGRPTALPHEVEPVPEIVSVRLEPPIALANIPKVEVVTLPLTTDAITAAIERARQSNGRFRLLDVEIRGRAVWLSGTAAQLDTGMEFAQMLTDLGVPHVVLQCNLMGGR